MKKVLYVIIALLLVYLVLAMFGPKEIKVERDISINKPTFFVKSILGDFKFFHDEWSPWSEKDSAMKTTYKGAPGELGHFYSWEGNKEVGKGEMEIISVTEDSLVQRLSFEGMGDSRAYFILKDSGTSTNVTWGMMFEVGFFGRPMMLFMNMDKMLGADYEKGLTKLKTKLESLKEIGANANYEIKEIQWDEKQFVSTKKIKMNGDSLGLFFGENFPKMWGQLEKEKIKSTMSPCGIFYSWDVNTKATECAAAMCVPKGVKLKGWDNVAVPTARVLSVPYYGAPEKSIDAHYAMEEYIKANKLDYSFVIEEYVTDPMLEKDTARWLTNIYYILK
ncbi:MAG: SRPBCC family protein [Bacteroidota bacterium]|nr:SRPBCC family protein [Bacteroidota bacterium]MDP3144315.1 SRPBCC family protein [Bacteroidota bacterium]